MEKELINKQKIPQDVITSFQDWFQREYFKRRRKNQSYSIRSYARYLNLEPSTVSQLLSGKRRPSIKFVKKLFLTLEITPVEQIKVLNSLSKKNELLNISESQKYQMIALDSFKILADWYHYAILELTSVENFKFDPLWVANQLNISVIEARQAIDRLQRLKLVEIKNGNLVKTNEFVTNFEEGITSSALKQLQLQVLQKALDAIENVSPQEKDITSMTMAIDESKLPEAKILIKKFRRELCRFLEKGKQTRVFNLAIQLYPISKGK